MASKKVLLVEDDEDIRTMFQLALEGAGYQILTAENGQEGLAVLAAEAEPCVILLDLMMPVMDGWAFAEAISKDDRYKNIPFVIVTAFAEDAVNIEKARGILKKPVDFKTLRSTVGQYCS